jgi:signal recognition particle receptor subunit beta
VAVEDTTLSSDDGRIDDDEEELLLFSTAGDSSIVASSEFLFFELIVVVLVLDFEVTLSFKSALFCDAFLERFPVVKTSELIMNLIYLNNEIIKNLGCGELQIVV